MLQKPEGLELKKIVTGNTEREENGLGQQQLNQKNSKFYQ